MHILPPLDLVEINPELRLRKEDVFCSLPRTSLSPNIEETRECAPVLSEVDAPDTSNLEVVIILVSSSIKSLRYEFVHCAQRPGAAEILGVSAVGETGKESIVEGQTAETVSLVS